MTPDGHGGLTADVAGLRAEQAAAGREFKRLREDIVAVEGRLTDRIEDVDRECREFRQRVSTWREEDRKERAARLESEHSRKASGRMLAGSVIAGSAVVLAAIISAAAVIITGGSP